MQQKILLTMTLLQKIRTSFSTQLSIWVSGFVVVTTVIVIALLATYSEDGIRNETIDGTLQGLENTAFRIDNTLKQEEITARLEKKQIIVDLERVERLLEETNAAELTKQALPNAHLFVTLRDSDQLAVYITGAESGYRQLMYDNKDMYIFTQPVGQRPFCLAAMCPASDIYDKYAFMYRILTFWSIGAILVLIYILYIVIARHLRSLHRLADTAQRIADGDLDTQIPEAHTKHEAGRLQSSLKKMQQSLRAYMDEMQQKQDTLSAHNAELQAAYDQAQAYEKKKAKFLHDMTERMAAPVELVCRSTNSICKTHSIMSQEDYVKHEADITKSTEEITALLDQLIKEAANS